MEEIKVYVEVIARFTADGRLPVTGGYVSLSLYGQPAAGGATRCPHTYPIDNYL